MYNYIIIENHKKCKILLYKYFSSIACFKYINLIVLGGYVTTCPLVLAELFSPAMIAKTFGLYFFAVGLSALAFTPIGGI
jgi:hypothetical protein